MHLLTGEVAAPGLLFGAGDLIAVCACVIVIGTLIAVAYTFERIAAVLDVGVFGLHPFHGVAVALRNTVIRWCETGIHDLEQVLTGLFHGLLWIWQWQWRTFENLTHAVFDTLHHVHKFSIPQAAQWALTQATREIAALRATVAADVQTLNRRITQAERLAETEALAAERAAETVAARYADSLVASLRGELSAVEATLAAELGTLPGEIRAAEDLIGTVTKRLQDEIDKLAAEAGTAGLAATITLLLTALAEAGLDNPECRAKVGRICSTDPSQWASLLEGIALLGFGLSLAELVPPARTAVRDLAGAVEALA